MMLSKYLVRRRHAQMLCACAVLFAISICGCKHEPKAEGDPPPAHVVRLPDMNLITIDNSRVNKFPIVNAEEIDAAGELNATGSVMPDVSHEVPVITLANGRVVDIRARIDDNVKKGQLLMKVQSSDVTNAFDAYLKASNDEQLAGKAFLRAQDLFQHGAVSQAMLEQAEGSAKNAKADVAAAEEQLKVLGADKSHPSSTVNVYAPISGVIISQSVTNASAAGAGLAGSPTAFTIADVSRVWVVCDVYENDISKLQVGQQASVSITAYPGRSLQGKVSDIGPILDPSLRTAKVRIEVANPGFLKLGMFATATFISRTKEKYAVVPANAVLHLHDRDWVYVPAGSNQFKRTEVRPGSMLSGKRQEILSGLAPGQQVVSNALMLETEGIQ